MVGDGEWGELTFDRAGRPGGPGRRRPRGPRCGPGDRVVLMMRNIPEFHWLDLAVLFLRGHPGLDLQLVVARAGRVPGRPLRGEGRHRRERRLPRQVPEGPRRAARPRAHRRRWSTPPDLPDGVRRPPTSLADAEPLDLAAAATVGSPRRPRHDHLHLGHHRPPQGRDAHQPQRGVDRRAPAGVVRLEPGRHRRQAGRVVPADGPHRRADDVHYQLAAAGYEVTTCPDAVACSPPTSARCSPTSCSACPGCGRSSTPASPRPWPPTRTRPSSSTRRSRRPRRIRERITWGTATEEEQATYAVPRRRGLLAPSAAWSASTSASWRSPARRPSRPSCSAGSGPSASRWPRSTA